MLDPEIVAHLTSSPVPPHVAAELPNARGVFANASLFVAAWAALNAHFNVLALGHALWGVRPGDHAAALDAVAVNATAIFPDPAVAAAVVYAAPWLKLLLAGGATPPLGGTTPPVGGMQPAEVRLPPHPGM